MPRSSDPGAWIGYNSQQGDMYNSDDYCADLSPIGDIVIPHVVKVYTDD